MVAPVTAAPTKSVETSTRHELKVWSRQKRPYNLILGLTHNQADSFPYGQVSMVSNHLSVAKTHAGTYISNDAAYREAYKRFVGKLGSSAGLGINLVQYRQSVGMMASRLTQLSAFTVGVLRRNPKMIARSLGLNEGKVKKMVTQKYGVANSLSSLWLEFWFGWKPLVSDIYSAAEVLEEPLPNTRVRARGTAVVSGRSGNPAPYYSELNHTWKYSVTVSLGADVAVTNPNLRFLEQMGLLNPAVVVWDAVPWSFVLDWFGGISSYLGSLSTFAGLTAYNGYIAKKAAGSNTMEWKFGAGYLGNKTPTGAFGQATFKSRTSTSTFPRPPLRISLPDLAPTRALTAISLLTQQLYKISR